MFGMLYIPNIVTAVPTVILDEDNSALSRQLVRDFEASDSYQVTAYVTSQEEMLAALHDQTAIAAIDIPHDFAKKARNGSYSTVLYLTNGANIILTNITSAAAQSITEDFSNHLAAQQVALRFGLNEEKVAHYIAPVVACCKGTLGDILLDSVQFFRAGFAILQLEEHGESHR
ncbi:MAG: ABC transporter permease [Selenomonadaceae bacterium]|nr:ABC transporter permease [Selenomonadaceae bacterium]MDY3915525.1 ABC transporter permease [Selenomonadaceae bacterium]